MEVSNLPDIEFKTIVIRMLKELMSRMDELRDNLSKVIVIIKKEIETTKENQSEMNNIILK